MFIIIINKKIIRPPLLDGEKILCPPLNDPQKCSCPPGNMPEVIQTFSASSLILWRCAWVGSRLWKNFQKKLLTSFDSPGILALGQIVTQSYSVRAFSALHFIVSHDEVPLPTTSSHSIVRFKRWLYHCLEDHSSTQLPTMADLIVWKNC